MKPRKLKLPGLILMSVLVLSSLAGWRAEAFGKTDPAEPVSRVILIFVDMSGSTNRARSSVYKEAFEKIYQKIEQGDRVIVGTITSRSYIEFKPAVDEEIPKKSIWDNRLQFERNLRESKDKIRREVYKLLSRKQGSPQTEILNSLNIAETFFHEERKRHKILVVLSDMIQDSKEYKFDREKITDGYINSILAHRQGDHLIPDLAGVKVYVAGASADDPERFRSVQTFWTRYFGASGADFSPYRYGHSLISFENGS